MIARIVELALAQRLLVLTLGIVLLFGGLYAFHVLDVVAYPDPSPPMVEVILISLLPRWVYLIVVNIGQSYPPPGYAIGVVSLNSRPKTM